jgi:hypothetical protein
MNLAPATEGKHMQMDTNYNLSQTTRTWSDSRAGSQPVQPSDWDGPKRHQTNALKAALCKEPDVRTDQVEKARRLIAQAQWPTRGTIHRFSALLAANMSERME